MAKRTSGKLEKRLHYVTRLAISLFVGVIAFLVIGQAAPEAPKPEGKKVIEADEFVIRDKSGNPRIKLGVDAPEAGIKIFDRKGKVALELSHFETVSNIYHSHLQVNSKDGTATLGYEGFDVRLSLHSPLDEEVMKREIEAMKSASKVEEVTRAARKGDNWLDLALGESGAEVRIGMDGQQRGAWIANREYTQLFLADTDGKARGLWDIAHGEPSFTLLDGLMRSRVVLGRLELKDSKSGAIERKSESSIVLLGESGNVIFSAP